MNISFNPFSATTWTTLAGVAGVVCGAIGAGGISGDVRNIITGLGSVLIALVGHHTTKAAVAKKSAAA